MELDFDKYKAQQCCANLECQYYAKTGEDNIRTHSRQHQQVYCNSCKNIWVITKGTFFYNLKAPVLLVLEVLRLLSEGMGLRAVCRTKGVTPDAVGSWLLKAAEHVHEVTVYLERAMHLPQCQIDEFWSYILKKVRLSADESEREDMGDRWTFVNVLPRSGFMHTAHHGKRTKEEAEQFVKTIKSHSDGAAPLFLSDGWKPYQEVLETTYRHEEPVPYLRIPRQSCHRFQVNPATDSTAKLPPVPHESCH
jgi:transposase-like protein